MSQALFPATRWTLVLASRSSPAARHKALEELLASYWKPLYVYARHCGSTHEDAQDAVQGLCARLLESEFLTNLDPQRGRLRAYLRFLFWDTVLECVRTARPVGRETALWLGVTLAVLPPTLEFFTYVAHWAP